MRHTKILKEYDSVVIYFLVCALFLTVLIPHPAHAANCTGTYTYTHTGTGGSGYNLNSGQSLLISSGTYTGNINNLSSTSTICVETGATFQPGNLNNVSGNIINYGTTTLGSTSFGSGVIVDNYGTFGFTGSLNTNGATTLNNHSGATMTMATSFQLGSNSTFNNDGLLTTQQDFNTTSGTTLNNTYRMELLGNFNPSGVVNNRGRVYAKAFININSGSSVTNYCSLVSYNGFNNNSNNTQNLGLILITATNGYPNDLWQNNNNFYNGPNAKVAGWRFINNATFTGYGALYFSQGTGYANTEHTKNQGPFTGSSASNPINFYDETQTGTQIFDFQNPAPTNTVRVAFERPTELDAPTDCSSTYKAFSAASKGAISGTVYIDSNGNDAYDSGSESGIGSIKVALYNSSGLFIGSTNTAANGSYSFTSLNLGQTYKVQVDMADTDLPAGASIGTTNPLTGISVTAGNTTANQNFGFDPASVVCNGATGAVNTDASMATLLSGGTVTVNGIGITVTKNNRADSFTSDGVFRSGVHLNKDWDTTTSSITYHFSTPISRFETTFQAQHDQERITFSQPASRVINEMNSTSGLAPSIISQASLLNGGLELRSNLTDPNPGTSSASFGSDSTLVWDFPTPTQTLTITNSGSGQGGAVNLNTGTVSTTNYNGTIIGGAFKMVTCPTTPTYNIAGTLFEDVNYGGGAGRAFGTTGTAGVSGARVELYNSTGTFVGSATTAAGGAYSFTGLDNGAYYVRVVNDTVKSTRVGSSGAERGVQTYRTDGTSANANEVGGRKPASVDAASNTTSQTLNTTTFLLSGGGQAQSVQLVTVASSNISGVNFGFNFDTVVNINDSGQGSLRQAILNANLLDNAGLAQSGRNNTYGVDTSVTKEVVLFNIPASSDPLGRANICGGTSCKIMVSTQLPTITKPAIIDGSSQPGYAAGTPSAPVIQIAPTSGLDARGLTIASTATDTTVRALSITDFSTKSTNVAIDVQAERAIVESCYLGLKPDGTAAANGSGIQLEWTQSAVIGGSTTAKRNIISGNQQNGIFYDTGASGGTIQNNFIGVNPAGTAAIGNQGRGIDTEGGANISILDNVISGNWGNGIEMGFSGGSGGANNITIRGNRIGVGINGETLGNSGPGIMNYGGSSGHQITQNIIAYNMTGGIKMNDTNVSGVVISQNAIYANGQLGIDLSDNGVTLNDANDADTGANSLLNFPVISQASINGGNLVLRGCAPAGSTVELFEADVSPGGKATPGDNKQGKSKDYGEGQTYLASFVEGGATDTDSADCSMATDADGNNQAGMKAFAVSLGLPANVSTGDILTATSSITASGTSEFSPAITIATPSSLSGKVFEDVQYGGGAGRAMGTTGTKGVNGARVELYDAGGAFVSSATTDASGAYTLTASGNSNYYVRVVGNTVKSTRAGSDGTERGIQTYRTDGTSAVANEIGGRNPALADAASNTSSQTLNTSTFVLSGGGQAQSVQAVALGGSAKTGVDFGFNFSTIVNTNDSGQGSLRQFILNSNLLAKTGLDQELPTALDSEYAAGMEVSIFMIPNSLLTNGVAIITPQTELPVSSKGNVVFDARTQTLNVGDSNSGTVGDSLTVGVDKLAVEPVALPEIALDCSAYPDHAGAEYCMSISGANSQVHGMTFYGADTGSLGDLSAALYIKPTATAIISGNLFGTLPGGTEPAWEKQNWRVGLLVEGNSAVTANYFAYNGFGAMFNGSTVTDSTFTANQMNENGPNVDAGSSNGSEDGNSLAIWGRAAVTIEGNYLHNSRGRNDSGNGGGKSDVGHGNLLEASNAGKALIRNNTLINGFVADIGVFNGSSNVRIEYNILTAARGTGRSPTGSGVLVNPLGKDPDPVYISRNSIFANNGLGIDLDPGNQSQTGNRVTKNDANDSDSGPNGLLNYPFFTEAYLLGKNLNIAGCAPAGADIEMFEADVSPGGTDAPGINKFGNAKDYGEGQIYLTTLLEGSADDTDTGECTHLSDSDGNNNRGMAAFRFSIPIPEGIVEGDLLTATSTLSGVGTSEFSLVSTEVVHITYDISGTVFEDVNYGGGPGRPFETSGTRGINDALVELFDAETGKMVTSTRTLNNGVNDGSYLFDDMDVAQYYVRVVTESLSSSRVGSDGSEVAVQTYRSDGAVETKTEIGGRHPNLTDGPAQQGSSLLDPTDFSFKRGPLNGDPVQSLQYVNLTNVDIVGVDFGFSFDTVVNSNTGGQGSLYQMILNANLLGDDASMTQTGRIAGKENTIFMLPMTDANFTAQDGKTYWSLRASELPVITAPLVIDGATQPGFSSKPVVELSGTGSNAGLPGLQLGGGSDASEIRNLGINNFTASGISISGSGHHKIQRNYIGLGVVNGTQKSNTGAGVLLTNASDNLIGGAGTSDGNIIANNTGDGITAVTTSYRNAFLGNSIYGNTGLGIDLADDGVTLNDVGDADIGPNDLLNYPEVQTNSFGANGSKAVTYDFDLDLPNSALGYRMEFFKNLQKDSSGHGEGRIYLGYKDITHPGTGLLNFKGTFNANQTVEKDDLITSTITEKTGAGVFGSTSEFSGTRNGTDTSVCLDLISNPDADLPDMMIDENATLITLLEAKDSNGDPITYVISGGADGTYFTINSTDPTIDCSELEFITDTGVVTKSEPLPGSLRAGPILYPGNFEVPLDAGSDNRYNVQITAITKDGAEYTHNLNAQVMNVNEAPMIITPAAVSFQENSQATVLDIQSYDQDQGDTEGNGLHYSISGGVDASLFSVDSGTGVLKFRAAPDFDAPADSNRDNLYEVEVTVTDLGGLTASRLFKVTVTNDTSDDGVTLQVRVMLQGAYDSASGLMADDLHVLGYLPDAQPYSGAPFNHKGSETLNSLVKELSGGDAVVDWMLLELRKSNSPAALVESRAVMVQRDGDLIDPQTGSPLLHFAGVPNGDYYVSVRHRNHLGVMTALPVALSATSQMVDFTLSSTAVFGGEDQRYVAGALALLWAGDMDGNHLITASGPNNDLTNLLGAIVTSPKNAYVNVNYILRGYQASDLNMDGQTLFTGSHNDTNQLLGNILLHPGNKSVLTNYIVRGTDPDAR